VDCVNEGAKDTRPARAGRAPVLARHTDTPIVVYTLIALNVGVFALTALFAHSLMENAEAGLFEQWSLRPIAVAHGEWWRLVTTGFLHFGPLHLLFNMWALYVLGRDLERVLGPLRFLVIYFVSLLGGAAAVYALSGVRAETAGASGAVFGLMAGAGVVMLRLGQSPNSVIILILINIGLSVAIPGISLVGHVGGLLVGAAVTAALVYGRRTREQWGGVGLIALALLTVIVVHTVRISSYAV
jgi:membrane associated rhomboid family serine protease